VKDFSTMFMIAAKNLSSFICCQCCIYHLNTNLINQVFSSQ
jgi:hypothetical protein